MTIPGFKCKGLLIAVSIFFMWGCAREVVVARVNGEAITKKQLKNMLRLSGIKGEVKTEGGDDAHKAMYPQLLDQLINERLVLQAAKKEKIKVDRKEVMKIYDDMVKAFPKEKDYLKRLKEKGMSKSMALRAMEKNLIIEKFRGHLFANLTVSEEESKDYYDKHIQAFAIKEQVRLSFIKADSLGDARRLKKELEHGAKFEDMARKYPAGHVERGGETGWITLNTFPSDMAKEIKKIKTGFFDGPIKGREGYYVIKVQERREEGVRPLDEVRGDIKQILLLQKKEARYQDWLRDARKSAKIEVLLQKG